MNYRAVVYYIGSILKVVSAFLLIPLITALCYQEWESALACVYTVLVFLAAGFLFAPRAPKKKKLGSKDGLIVVGLSWIIISCIGALPFVISRSIPNYFDALFETISGFTTTGATILNDVEAMPHGMLMWRSLTHWLGGMGILLFVLAIIPSSDGSTFQLMRFETPGPQVGKLVSKVRHSAAISYIIYLVLTVVEIIFLLCGGIGVFDSVNLAFSTAGTGGFAVTNTSILAYDSLYIEIVLIVFMLIFSINFNIYYLMVIGKFSSVLRNEEFRMYLAYFVIAIVALTFSLLSQVNHFGEALRQAAFVVASMSSSTGFTTVDFAQWSEAAKAIVAIVSIIGACSGSTGGGFKFSRFIVVMKCAGVTLINAIRPNTIQSVKLDKKPFSDQEVSGITGYFLLFVLVIVVSCLLLCLLGHDLSVSFYTTITMIGNDGPNLAASVGATASYVDFGWAEKAIMMADMLIGRLEIYPILLLFTPQVWSKHF